MCRTQLSASDGFNYNFYNFRGVFRDFRDFSGIAGSHAGVVFRTSHFGDRLPYKDNAVTGFCKETRGKRGFEVNFPDHSY